MARVAAPISNWNKGEWGKKMYGRIDVPAYRAACRKMLNALPYTQGGFSSRAGSRYVTGTKANVAPELLPFEFNLGQAFAIEAGGQYFRFYYNPTKSQLYVPATTATITNGDFASGITGWTDSSTGSADLAYDSGNKRMSLVAAASGVAIARQTLTVPASQQHSIAFQTFGALIKVRVGTSSGGTQLINDFALNPGTHVISFTSSGTSAYLEFRNDADAAITAQIDNVAVLSDQPLELVTPYALADVANIRWTQSADVMYLVCAGGYAPQVLKRRSNISWSIETFDYQNGPYYSENTDNSLTLTPSSYSGSVTVTASKNLFKSTDVGRHLRLSEKEDTGFHTGWGIITAYTSPKAVTMLFKVDLESDEADATYKWRLGAWGGVEGYPSVVALYEDRLCFANTPTRPYSIWASSTGVYNDFNPAGTITSNDGSLLDDVQPQNSLFFTLSDGKVNPILWMVSAQTLLVGTAASEFSVSASTLNEALTPDNVKAVPQTNRGGSAVPPVEVDGRPIFVGGTGRKIFELVFDGVSLKYMAGDLTLYADHMLAGSCRRLAYQKEPRSLIWAACSDGTLRSLSYVPDQQILGWARHTLGGQSSKVMTVCALSGARQSTLWMVTERIIQGVAQHYVEYMSDDFDAAMGDTLASACFLDCSLQYVGGAATVFTGLDHLEGETVGVVGDGKVVTDQVVSGGSITLPNAASVVQIGLRFPVEVETMPNILGSQNGAAIGKRQAASQVFLQFIDTVGGTYGRTCAGVEQFEDIPARQIGDPLDSPPNLFNGLKRVEWPAGYDDELTFEVRQNQPMPLAVTGIFPTMSVADS